MRLHSFLARSTALVFGLALLTPVGAKAQNRVISTDLTNIAAAANGGRVLNATSVFQNDKNFSADNLIDGQVWSATRPNSSHGWASDRYDPISLEAVTIGFNGNRLYKIGKIVLNPMTDLPPERWAKDVEVQVSSTTVEGPYTPIAQLTLRQKGEPQAFNILPTDARFVRLAFRSNYGSDRAIALGEVEIYEAIDAGDPMGSVITNLDGAINELRAYRKEMQTGGLAVPSAAVKNTGLASSANRGKTNIVASKNGGRVVAYSSTYSNDAQFGPDKLIDGEIFRMADGKGSWGWASEGFTPGKEYVTLGFAEDSTRLIDKVVLNAASNQTFLRWARRVEVQVTTGDFRQGPWKTASILNLQIDQPNEANQTFEFRPVEAKYVRFVFQANGPGVILPNADPNVNSDRAVSLGEIEIYEAASSDDQLEALIGKFNQALVDLKTLRRQALADDQPAEVLTSLSVPTTEKPKTVAVAKEVQKEVAPKVSASPVQQLPPAPKPQAKLTTSKATKSQ